MSMLTKMFNTTIDILSIVKPSIIKTPPAVEPTTRRRNHGGKRDFVSNGITRVTIESSTGNGYHQYFELSILGYETEEWKIGWSATVRPINDPKLLLIVKQRRQELISDYLINRQNLKAV